MQYDMYGNPIPTLTQQTSLLGFDPSTKNRPMLMPVKEDGSWTAPEWFHSMSKLPAGMLSMAKGQPFSISAGELAEGGLNFAGMGTGTSVAKGAKPQSSVMGMFGGPKAVGRDKEALKVAKEQIKWDSPYATWRKTGWFKDNDGVWKFEIDDASSRFRMKPSVLMPDVPKIASDEFYKYSGQLHPDAPRVSDLLHHPDLYSNYPTLSNAQILRHEGTGDVLASFGRQQRDNPFGTVVLDDIIKQSGVSPSAKMSLDPEKQLHSVMLHELQHGIEFKEPKFGQPWAEGHFKMNSPERIQQQGGANELVQQWIGYLNAHNDANESLGILGKKQKKPSFDQFWNMLDNATIEALAGYGLHDKKKVGRWMQEHLGITPDSPSKDLKRWKRKAIQDHHDIAKVAMYGEKPELASWQSKGEMEARNVQERFLLPEDVKKYKAPWETEGDYRETAKLLGFQELTPEDYNNMGHSMYNFPREHNIITPPHFPDLNRRLGILGDR